MKLLPLTLFTSMLLALTPTGISLADDGAIHKRDLSKTPALESAHAALRMLPLYVPAQSSDGELLTEGIEYYDADGALVETRFVARPLISHYTDGHVEGIDEEGYGGFPGHGERDAFGAVSLDDGATWKDTNLSKSGDQSSIRIKLGGRQKIDYPGDVGRSFAASDGNKALIIWVSRYARGGNPTYAIPLEELEVLAPLLQDRGTIPDAAPCIDEELIDTPCLYLEDHFGVAGSQGVSDLADEGLPLIGQLPYAAVWVARGVMLPPVEEGDLSRFVWFKAERLSSAVRDANRPEAVCVKGAGCVVTWQEDPDGIRPGHGDGPGEGWSGAIAHHKTDTWYSYIDWDDFDLVIEDTYGTLYNETGLLTDWVIDNPDGGSPQAAIPMAIPVRLTDNAMCVALEEDSSESKSYCHVDFDDNGTPDFCASTVSVEIETPEGPLSASEMCVTEDGRLMRGTTASTRPRLGLHGYSTLGDYRVDPAAYPIDSAWFTMAYEENKGLGDICDDGDCEVIEDADKRDMGKNIWYHTFDMFEPELVDQGLMLNQPAVYPDGTILDLEEWTDPSGLLESLPLSGFNFWAFIEDPIYETQAGITTTTLYQTEIARRSSPITQDWYDAGETRTVALQLWKAGIVRRGGPADIFGRRFVIPESTTTGEQCNSYELCTTPFTLITTTYAWCDSEPVCVDNDSNPEYDYNKGQCKKDPDQPRCFEFITPDDEYTNDPQTCTDGQCFEDESECGLTGGGCEETVIFDSSLTSCPDPSSLAINEVCEEGTESCSAVGFCDPDAVEENQVCIVDIVDCPGGFDPAVDNPYDYANMECLDANGESAWHFTDGINPRYVKGLCAGAAINLSASTILTAESCDDAETCLGAFPFSSYWDDLVMADDSVSISKIESWGQYGPNYDGSATTLEDPPDDGTNLNDMSWENPYDVAKGHRGFMTGDMVMVMYAASPNWKMLTDAHAPFNLYNRRSFDGGQTWTTLPTDWPHTNDVHYSGNGTTTCEWMVMEAEGDAEPVCTEYGPGDFEQARNVSQLVGSQVTVLDPRYAPTARSITADSVNTASLPEGFSDPVCDGTEADVVCDDARDPSRYFMVYETGETSAYDAGEAPPLDLFYSRAIEWGDQYLVYQDEPDATLCLPSADDEIEFDMTGFCNEFDALEGWHDKESGEAAVAASPGGQFFYSVWNQEDLYDHEVIKSDIWFRRVMFLDDYVPTEYQTP